MLSADLVSQQCPNPYAAREASLLALLHMGKTGQYALSNTFSLLAKSSMQTLSKEGINTTTNTQFSQFELVGKTLK